MLAALGVSGGVLLARATRGLVSPSQIAPIGGPVETVREGEIEQTWSRIEAWMQTNAPAAVGVLRPGVPETAIRAAEKDLGLALPESFRRSLKQHDGQKYGPSLIEFGILMPLGEIVVDSRDNEKRLEEWDGPEGEAWWRRGWVPFVSRDGDYLSLALGPTGNGEVWCFQHDAEPMHSLIAPNFGTWLERWAGELEADVFEADVSEPGGSLSGLLPRTRKTSRLWPPD